MPPEHIRGCTGKRKFATRELAVARTDAVAARRLARPQYPYQCEHCGCWHTSGTSPEREARRRKAVLRRHLRAARSA